MTDHTPRSSTRVSTPHLDASPLERRLDKLEETLQSGSDNSGGQVLGGSQGAAVKNLDSQDATDPLTHHTTQGRCRPVGRASLAML